MIDNVSKPPACRILEIETGGVLQTISLRAQAADVVWSTDGSTMAIPGNDHKIDLWDIASGTLRVTLDGHASGIVRTAFHPSDTLLASRDMSGELRLWDPVLGRPLLKLKSDYGPEFSQDGRIVVKHEDQFSAYQVEPALAYRTFAHISRERINYAIPSVRHDGRLLAVGTDQGALLWDLARGTELASLPIANSWHLMFEPSGDLITSGSMGVHRWPIRLEPGHREFLIGPPRPLRLPAGHCGIAEDQSSRIVAKADQAYGYIATAKQTIRVGRLNDCRSVAVSPNGQWLATGTHSAYRGGVRVWRVSDGKNETDLPIEYPTGVAFSPDGKWLLTSASPCRLWEVGTWREVRQLGGLALCFSPDSRMVAVRDANNLIHLVETETGNTLARLESPDLSDPGSAVFSPDGSRLVVSTNDSPAVHVWDLREIRKHLSLMGLDWHAPTFSDLVPDGPGSPALPPLRVDLGPLEGHSQHFTTAASTVLQRYTARVKEQPGDADAHHHRAHALVNMKRFEDAIGDLNRAIQLRPLDIHYRAMRGVALRELKQLEPAIADLEAALAHDADEFVVQESLAQCCRLRAWTIVSGQDPQRELSRALVLARRAVELAPNEIDPLNTLGVVLYRAGFYAEAIANLDRASIRRGGEVDPVPFLYRAMAHHRLGNRTEARAAFDRVIRWLSHAQVPRSEYRSGVGPITRRGRSRTRRPGGRAAGRRLRPRGVITSSSAFSRTDCGPGYTCRDSDSSLGRPPSCTVPAWDQVH